jgi:serine/threonine protein kinase
VKAIESTTLSFEANDISTPCKDFLNGVLEKNIHKRFTLDEVTSHPWLIIIKEKVEEIVSRYQYDPDKMIDELNKAQLTDDYFKGKNYTSVELKYDDKFINKKRKRSKSS